MWNIKTNASARRGRLLFDRWSHLLDSLDQIAFRAASAPLPMSVNRILFRFTELFLFCFPQGTILLELSCKCALICCFFFLPATTGQLQDVSLGVDEPAPRVEVSPELDLEVVPEPTGDWHTVFPWLRSQSFAAKVCRTFSWGYKKKKISDFLNKFHLEGHLLAALSQLAVKWRERAPLPLRRKGLVTFICWAALWSSRGVAQSARTSRREIGAQQMDARPSTRTAPPEKRSRLSLIPM